MLDHEQEYLLSFDDVSTAEANRLASELGKHLRDRDSSITIRPLRQDAQAQDFGGTLVLILGTKAVVSLAAGLAAWLAMRPKAKVTIKGKDGTIIASGLTSADARAIVEERLRGPEGDSGGTR
jgi:uncharacterized membrane protein